MADLRPAELLPSSGTLLVVRERVDAVLRPFLSARRAELAGMDPSAVVLVDELGRLLEAGGKRIRPALCLWAHRAAGGSDGEPVARASAALELLHTFALVHDDVMDRSTRRRGVPSTYVRFADEAPAGVEAEGYGVSVAILVGDLAAAMAEELLRACGAPAGPLEGALRRFDRMRLEMAAGQLLDLGAAPSPRTRVAALKTGSYTAEGPVLIATALAEAGPAVEGPLRVYAHLLGEAFQLRDDVLDGEAAAGASRRVDELVDRAMEALDGAPLEAEGAAGLSELARLLKLGSAD